MIIISQNNAAAASGSEFLIGQLVVCLSFSFTNVNSNQSPIATQNIRLLSEIVEWL